MKPLEMLKEHDFDVIVFDSDGVTIEKGTELSETVNTLKVKTNVITDEMTKKINELKKHYTVVISSGRSLMHLQKAYFKVIDENVWLQAENGIFTLKGGNLKQNHVFSHDDMESIKEIKKQIQQLKNKEIKGFEPKTFLITVHCENRIPEIEEIVARFEGFYYMWNGEAYDILKKGIDKGFGLKEFEGKKVLAVGNGENDKPMTDKAHVGVTTDINDLQADYYTRNQLENGGLEVIDYLLERVRK